MITMHFQIKKLLECGALDGGMEMIFMLDMDQLQLLYVLIGKLCYGDKQLDNLFTLECWQK